MMQDIVKDQLLAYLGTGVWTSVEIQKRFGVSQATVSRLINSCGVPIFPIGERRSRRYTRLRDVRGLGAEFPVCKIDSEGNVHLVGILYAIATDWYHWAPVKGDRVEFRSLPWFLADLRPDGFVGRAFVRQLHEELGLPPRSVDWSEDQVLVALARRGEDCMGNLIVGHESLERYLSGVQEAPTVVRRDDIERVYPEMANKAMDGQPVGSSAGGEQPKFTLVVEGEDASRHVMVKFSPLIHTVEGRRWADLLVCEYHALEVARQTGIPAAETRVTTIGNRMFLESIRFDRVGLFGRLPIISLRAVDNEFYGQQDNWIFAASRLEEDRRLTQEHARWLRWLCIFSDLTANVDQHFGNVSLVMVDGRRRFELAPAYDVLPMLYRPRDGEAPRPNFNPPRRMASAPREWNSAVDAAVVFWERISIEPLVSEEFRGVASENLQIVRQMASGPRMML